MAEAVDFKVTGNATQGQQVLGDFFDMLGHRVRESVRDSGKLGQGLDSIVGGLAKGRGGMILLGAAVAAVAVGITTLVKRTYEANKELNEMARLTDMSTQRFSAMASVMEDRGIDAARLAQNLSDLAKRAANLDPIFKELGISVFDRNGAWKETGDLMLELAGVFERMPPSVERTQLAFKLFGADATRMLSALSQGKGTFRDAFNEAIVTGKAVDQGVSERFARAAENFSAAGSALKGIFAPIKTAINETVSLLVEGVSEFAKTVLKWGEQLWNTKFGRFLIELMNAPANLAKFGGTFIGNLSVTGDVSKAYDAGVDALAEDMVEKYSNELRAAIPGGGAEAKKKKPAFLNDLEAYKFAMERSDSNLALNALGFDPEFNTGNSTNKRYQNSSKQLQSREVLLQERIGFLEPKINEVSSQFPSEGMKTDEAGRDRYQTQYAAAERELIPLLAERAKVLKEIEEIQEHLNELENEDIEAQVYGDKQKFSNQMAEGLGNYVKQWTGGQAVINTAIQTIDTALTGLSEAVTGLITGTASWADVWRQTVTSMIGGIVQLMVKFVALLAIVSLLSFLFPGSSFVANFRSFAGLKPMAEGGYTGDGGKWEPAGLVHRGEYVIPKSDVQRIGLGNIELFRRGIPTQAPSLSYDRFGGGSSSTPTASAQRPMIIAPLFDKSQIYELVRNHPEFEVQMVDMIGRSGFVQR